MSWRHYDFGVRVKQVFLRAGGEVVSPDERYTTMTCGACGRLNEKHSLEQWTCKHCSAFHLRDPAASRCIFIKSLVPDSNSSSSQPAQQQADSGNDATSGQLQPTNTRSDEPGDSMGPINGIGRNGDEPRGDRRLQ